MANVIHISESEAARTLPALLAKVAEGSEVVIERETQPVAYLTPALPPTRASEIIAAMRRVGTVRMGADYADDLEEILKQREPWEPQSWD